MCIFHGLARYDTDDMGEHDRYVVVYEKLRQLGFPDAF